MTLREAALKLGVGYFALRGQVMRGWVRATYHGDGPSPWWEISEEEVARVAALPWPKRGRPFKSPKSK